MSSSTSDIVDDEPELQHFSCVDIDAYTAYYRECATKSSSDSFTKNPLCYIRTVLSRVLCHATKVLPRPQRTTAQPVGSSFFPLFPSQDKPSNKARDFYRNQTELTARNIRLHELQRLHRDRFRPSGTSHSYTLRNENSETDAKPDGNHASCSTHSLSAAAVRRVSIAMCGSLAINVLLLLVKLVAVYLSRSLTVIASVLDSVLDIFSGIFLLVLNTVVRRVDTRKYPIGTKRLEPLGVLIFSSIMASASLSVMQHCLASLYEHITSSTVGINHSLVVVIIMEIVVVVKFAMFMYCRTLVADDVICAALIRDHRNDVLSNTAGLCGVLLTLLVHIVWDDIIGISITLYIIVNWSQAAYAQMRELSCKSAPHAVVNQVIFVALNHHPAVVAIEKVKVYSVGCGYHAEVDIVLPPEMSLRSAHDIGESLQVFLEEQNALPIVRAYVHTDYETNHHSNEHR